MPTNSQFVLTGSYLRTSEDIFTGPGGYRFTRGADGQAFVSNQYRVSFDDDNIQKIDTVFIDKSTLGGVKYSRYRSDRVNNFTPNELPNVITVSKSGSFYGNADFSNQTFTKMAKNPDWITALDSSLEHRPDKGGYEATINGINYFIVPKASNSFEIQDTQDTIPNDSALTNANITGTYRSNSDSDRWTKVGNSDTYFERQTDTGGTGISDWVFYFKKSDGTTGFMDTDTFANTTTAFKFPYQATWRVGTDNIRLQSENFVNRTTGNGVDTGQDAFKLDITSSISSDIGLFHTGNYKLTDDLFNNKKLYQRTTGNNVSNIATRIGYEPNIDSGSWIIFNSTIDSTAPISESAVLFKVQSTADEPPASGWSTTTYGTSIGVTLNSVTKSLGDLAPDVPLGNWVLFHDGHSRIGETFQAENIDFGTGIIPITSTNTLVGNADGGGNASVTFTISQTPTTGYLHVFKDYDPGGVAHWLLAFKSTSTLSGSNIFVRAIRSDTRTPNLSTVYHPFVNIPDPVSESNNLPIYSSTFHSQDTLTNYFWTLDDIGETTQTFGQFTWDFSNTEGDSLTFESRPFSDFNITPDTAVWSATPLSATSIGYKSDPGTIRQRQLFFGPTPTLDDDDKTATSQTSTFRASGLASDNRYYWKVNLTNDAGTTESEIFSFTTSAVQQTSDSVGTTGVSAPSDSTSGTEPGDPPDVGAVGSRLVVTGAGYIIPTSGYVGGDRYKLERLISGEKSKIFKTSKGVMVGALEEDYTNFEANSGNTFNKFSSYATSRKALVKNLYHSDEFKRQSHVNVPITQDDDGLLNVISPDVQQLSVTQFNETAIGMTDLTNKKIKYLSYDANKNTELMLEGGNAIAVYPPSGSINQSRSDVPSAALEPTFIVSGLDFNFIEETPVEFEFLDFNSGLMYSNVMNTKNMYDSKYNTDVVVSGDTFATKSNFLTGDTNLIGHLSAEVRNSRYYIDVNSDGNHLLYNVYRTAKNYEPDSDFHSTAKMLKPLNSDPYFRSWNINNNSPSAWVTSGDSQTDSNRRLSAFVEEFRLTNKATGDKRRKRANQFDLFGAVVMSGKSKVQTNGQTLQAGQTYTFRVELDTQHLSGNGTSFFRSNGSKVISAPGITQWQYQVSTTDPNSSHLFLSGDHNDSQCILKSLSVAKGNRSLVAVRNKGVKNNNFSNWNHTDDSADNYYSKPTDWTVIATSGLVSRDERFSTDFDEVRSCISMAKSGFVEISNTNNTFNTLSAADKTYAILVKFPDHLPRAKTLSGSNQARDTDDERLGLIGKPGGFTEGEDHIAIFPPGKTVINHAVSDSPRVVWRGGSAAAGAGEIYDADQNYNISPREFDGQWKWLVFRKDRSNTDKKFAMTNNVSGFKTESKNDTDININTFNPGVGASSITPYMQGRSSLTFSRYYEWNRSLTDGETEGIIKLNHIPSGALVGYKFENPYTEKITNTLSANARDGLLIRVEDTNGNKEEMDTFWSDNMKIKRPNGGVRMYNNGTGYTNLEQAGAFISPSGFYDISITTSDFASGTVSLSCGLAPIGITNEPGTKRFKFNKVGTNAVSSLSIRLTPEGTTTPISGFGDVVVNSVNVTCLSANYAKGDAGNNASLYDLAERVDGFYRYQTIPIHKSNLFSIRINNSRLNKDQTLGEVEKENIRKSVTNVVKNIVDKITPVHTQLLGIDFTGE